MNNGWYLEYYSKLGLHSKFLELTRQEDFALARDKAKQEIKEIAEKQANFAPTAARIVWKYYESI